MSIYSNQPNKPQPTPTQPSQPDMTELLRLDMLSSLELFTTVMFQAQYRKSFVVSKHHRLIFQALQDVVDGRCTRLMINMPPRYSKAIDMDTPMLTQAGWKKARDLTTNDWLFGMDGKLTRILACCPQGVTQRWRVTFSDGSSLIASDNHLWIAKSRDDVKRGNDWRVVRTSDFIRKLYDGRAESKPHYKWHIPTTAPIDGGVTHESLPIDPYVLGCWLGDGHSHQAAFTSMDCCIVDAFKRFYMVKPQKHQNAGKAITYGVTGGLHSALKQLNLLGNKHIPVEYLLASKSDRLELLRGLMDTDGTCSKISGQVSYCCTNGKLRRDVRTLMESLGCYVTECNSSVLLLRSKLCPFRLERKAVLWSEPTNHAFSKRQVVSVDRLEDGETICFAVDNESHSYLAGKDLIVTHNTEIVVKAFMSWCFALNPKCKFLHLSYSDTLVNDNSAAIRSAMAEPLYKKLFPKSQLESEKGSTKRWKTKAGGELYAVSTQGQVTGFGAGDFDIQDGDRDDSFEMFSDGFASALRAIGAVTNIFQGAIVIDDPLKPDDADSDIVRERINQRFEATVRSRVNSRNTPIIIIMQRLHEHDLCGYLQELEPNEWRVLSLPAIQVDEHGNDSALWPAKHTLKELIALRLKNPQVFDTQYMQNPTPKEGLMYSSGFRTYSRAELPTGSRASKRWCYVDTADTGSDHFCAIFFIDTPETCYVTDVLFTKEPMEYTERELPKRIVANGTTECTIEGNNGGRGYARKVKSELRSTLRFFHCVVKYFTQKLNKQTRIFTNSAGVMSDIAFPDGWERLWPEFYAALTTYRKEAKRGQHDDAPDCLTGVFELHSRKLQQRGVKLVNG